MGSEMCIRDSPISGHSSKDWGIEKYKVLIHLLSEKYKIIIFGSSGDKGIKEFYGKNIYNMCGKMSLKEFGALIKFSNFTVGGDSAATHIAAVFNKKALTIFSGAALYEEWHPYGKNSYIVYKDVVCRGCELLECNRNHECMDISPRKIYLIINNIIKGKIKKII